ncbi:MAG: glycosyltransferase family 39 protein [Chloroflexi bacterium]|nr:glycosyltransferase family 39 protein [Chloroflexota bacterium]
MASGQRSPARNISAHLAFLIFILLLAFLLRVFRIDFQSLWGDEAIAIFWAQNDLAGVYQEAIGSSEPPLYYLALHYWQSLAGTREFALRYLSLLFGVLTIPLLYQLGRTTLGQSAGLYAATLAALSPYYIYYSQETRMYAQTAFLTALSMACLILLLFGEKKRSGGQTALLWTGYVLAAAAAIYTLWVPGFILLAVNIYFLIFWRRHRPHLWPWVVCQASILALSLPIVLASGQSLSRRAEVAERASIPITTVLREVSKAFSLGNSVDDTQTWLTLGFVALLILGSVAMKPRRSLLFWLLLLVIPIAAIYYVSFAPQKGWPRYFMVASLPFYVLIAYGLRALQSRRSYLAFFGLLFLLVASGTSLNNYYSDPRYARYDYRSQIARLEAMSLPTDAVIVNGRPRFPNFYYYFKNTIPDFPIPRDGAPSRQEVAAQLERLANSHTGLWLVKYMPPDYDADNFIQRWLAKNTFKTYHQWVENVTFSFYSTPSSQPAPIQPLKVDFEDQAQLVGYWTSVVEARGGRVVQLTLFWQARKRMEKSYTIFAQLLDPQGRKVGQWDSPPEDGFNLTSSWRPGEVVEDRRGIYVPNEAWSDSLYLGLYNLADGRRLKVWDEVGKEIGDHVTLALLQK